MFHCSITYNYPVREIAIPVAISCTICPDKIKNCKGIVDTGATASMISGRIAKQLDLVPNGTVTVSGVHGSTLTNTYLADVSFGNYTFLNLPVSEADDNAGFDFLIGMDILGMGNFSFSTTSSGHVFRLFLW